MRVAIERSNARSRRKIGIMVSASGPARATLLDVLIDAFEKNEVLHGFHVRSLPLPDESSAVRKFESFVAEARRWKGDPDHLEERPARRRAAWPDFEVRQAGRGVLLLVRATGFSSWWNTADTWRDDPMGEVRAWLQEE